jgi:hypothetical protein
MNNSLLLPLKKCSTCGMVKPVDNFYVANNTNDGLRSHCKKCDSLYSKKYRKNNLKKCKEMCGLYRKNNLTKIKDMKRNWDINNKIKVFQYNREYIKNNPNKVKKWNENATRKSKENPMYKLNTIISSGMRRSLLSDKKGYHWEKLVNYTVVVLKNYMEKLFLPGMSWENQGRWHIDHIIPISWWQFKNYNDREFKQCWALCNLQPLWAKDNLTKSNKHTDGWMI